MTRALEHLGDLMDCPRPDGNIGTRLADEIAAARRVGMVGQQIARLANGQVRPDPERVLVCELVSALLRDYRMANPDGLELHDNLQRTTADCDASLMSALIHAVLNWSVEHAVSPIVWRLTSQLPLQGSVLRVSYSLKTHVIHDVIETIDWHLLQFLAQAMNVRIECSHDSLQVDLSLAFAGTEGVSGQADAAQPDLARERLVLVVAPARDLRNKVRLALRGLNLLVDYVSTVDAAVGYLGGSQPHVVVYDGELDKALLQTLWHASAGQVPELEFIELAQQVSGLEALVRGGSCVDVNALDIDLPKALGSVMTPSH